MSSSSDEVGASQVSICTGLDTYYNLKFNCTATAVACLRARRRPGPGPYYALAVDEAQAGPDTFIFKFLGEHKDFLWSGCFKAQ